MYILNVLGNMYGAVTIFIFIFIFFFFFLSSFFSCLVIEEALNVIAGETKCSCFSLTCDFAEFKVRPFHQMKNAHLFLSILFSNYSKSVRFNFIHTLNASAIIFKRYMDFYNPLNM